MIINWNRPYAYLQIHPDGLLIKDIASGRSLEEEPLAAIHHRYRDKVLAVGAAARARAMTVDARLVNPFKHPRTLVANISVGEIVVRSLLQRLYDKRMFMPAPRILLHPLTAPEDGFAPIELHALREIALNAGACRVKLWLGPELTNTEIQNIRF